MFDTSGIELNLNSLRFPAAGLRFRSLQAFSTESWKCCNCMWRAPLMPSNYAFIYVQNAFQQSSRGFVMMWTPARVAGILAIGMTRLDKRSPGFLSNWLRVQALHMHQTCLIMPKTICHTVQREPLRHLSLKQTTLSDEGNSLLLLSKHLPELCNTKHMGWHSWTLKAICTVQVWESGETGKLSFF